MTNAGKKIILTRRFAREHDLTESCDLGINANKSQYPCV